ncbi:unnamed protein product [Prunus armeniaca]
MTKSSRNHPSPTAGKKAQVKLDPVIPSSSKGSPFVATGRVVGFFFKCPIFLFFLVHSRPSLGIFNESSIKPSFDLFVIVAAWMLLAWVLARKCLLQSSEIPFFFVLLGLPEGYICLRHR